jgi:hypothetical protein
MTWRMSFGARAPAAYLLARLPRRSKATPWSLAAGVGADEDVAAGTFRRPTRQGSLFGD